MAYAEELVSPPAGVEEARAHAAQRGGAQVDAVLGSLLRVLGAALPARAVVEVGGGTGSAELWLIAGMPHDGIITAIETDAEALREARTAILAAGVASNRIRAINGDPVAVLSRLADRAYDLALIGGEVAELQASVEEAIRVLKPGGVLVVDHMLQEGSVADPAARDPQTRMVRDLGRAWAADERLVPCLLPISDGVLLAVRTAL